MEIVVVLQFAALVQAESSVLMLVKPPDQTSTRATITLSIEMFGSKTSGPRALP